MKKEISFGKIAYNGSRKINRVTVEIKLKEIEAVNWETGKTGIEYVFTACGNVSNNKGTDCVACGQVLNDLVPFFRGNKLFKEIYTLWQKYHLNDIRKGAKVQIECLKALPLPYDYDKAVQHLKDNNLLTVDLGGVPYTYGHAWLCEPIPVEVVARIKQLIQEN